MMRTAWPIALLLVASCARCAGPRGASSAEELLPRGTSGAILSAPLGVLARHAAALADRVGQLAGGEDVAKARASLPAQFGFDPFTREGQLAAGLDPDRGAAATLQTAAAGRGSWVAALPLTKPNLFLEAFDRLARERAGYPTRTDEARGELRIAVYARERDKLAVAVVRGYGVVARGEDPAGDLAAASQRKPGESLASDAPLQALRGKLGAQDLIVFAPKGSPLSRRLSPQPLPGDVALGLGGSAEGLGSRLIASLPEAEARRAQAALPGGGADLVELLPAGAPFRMRLGVSPQALYAELQGSAAAGLFEKLPAAAAVFATLLPGAVVSVSLRPQANLAAAIDSGFDPRRKSPFDTLQLVALARVKDAAAARKAIAGLVGEMPRIGARAIRHGDDVTVTLPTAGEGVRFGIRDLEGKPVAYFLGGGLAPEDLRRTPKPASLDPAALYADQGAAFFVDFGKLAEAVRALPEGAYGTGPQAYVARSVVSQIVEPLRTVKIEGGAVATPDGVTGDLVVGLKKP